MKYNTQCIFPGKWQEPLNIFVWKKVTLELLLIILVAKLNTLAVCERIDYYGLWWSVGDKHELCHFQRVFKSEIRTVTQRIERLLLVLHVRRTLYARIHNNYLTIKWWVQTSRILKKIEKKSVIELQKTICKLYQIKKNLSQRKWLAINSFNEVHTTKIKRWRKSVSLSWKTIQILQNFYGCDAVFM